MYTLLVMRAQGTHKYLYIYRERDIYRYRYRYIYLYNIYTYISTPHKVLKSRRSKMGITHMQSLPG